MTAQIGLFSDIHGSWENLELIVKTFKNQSISSSIFLGDALYETLSSLTVRELQKKLKIKNKLRQDSDLRKEVLEGYFSDTQIRAIVEELEQTTELSKKIAKKEYITFKEELQDLQSIVLGGNWDYRKEIQEVFDTSYINAEVKDLEGITIAGFSGGGSPVTMNLPDATLADNQQDEKYEFRSWARLLGKKEDLNADIYVSHVPFTDGEGVKEENSVEHLKEMVIKRRQMGFDTPSVFIYGHKHTSGEVRYDEELGGFLINPGTSSKNHNDNFAPSFMAAKFDDNNKLRKLFKYELRSSLEGLSNVVLTQEFELDYENKKVKTTDKNDIIISEIDKRKFEENLKQDPNYSLLQDKISLDYNVLSDSEKDELLRRNVAIMFKEIKERSEEISNVIKSSSLKVSEKDKITDISKFIETSYQNLSDKALFILGGSLDHVSEEEKDFFRDIALEVVYGINMGDIQKTAADKSIEDINSISSLEKDLVNSSSSNLSKRYQGRLFDQHLDGNLQAEDYQSMAEIYMPQNFKRKKDMEFSKAFNLWVKTYQEGILTQGDMDEFKKEYSKDEDYQKTPITKTELAKMFKFEVNEKYIPITDKHLRDTIQDLIKTSEGVIDLSKLSPEIREQLEERSNALGIKLKDDQQKDNPVLKDNLANLYN